MPIPSSGAFSFSTIRSEYGSTFKSFSLWYSIAAGVPSSGTIRISSLRGTSASVPSISAISNINHDTSGAAQNGSYNLSTNVTDTYGAPVTYFVLTYTNSFFASIPSVNSSTGALTYQVAYNKFANTTPIVVLVTNRFGKTANATVPLYIYGIGPTSSSMGSVTLTNNSAPYTVSNYFTDSYSGTSLTYSLTSNPQSSASLLGTTLTVTGNNRNTSYTVSVTATNGYNQTAISSLSVTEQAAASGVTTLFSSLSSSVSSAKSSIESAGYKLFATPITSALAESIATTTSISTTGQFNSSLFTTSFTNTNKLYGTFFLNNVRQFSIVWTFTDGTNSMDSFFNKSNRTDYGASYTFTVYNASGSIIYGPTSTSYKWCFSDDMNYNTTKTNLSDDDGVWGAATSNLNPNAGNSQNRPLSSATNAFGFTNNDSSDSTGNILYNNSSASASGTVLAFIYF